MPELAENQGALSADAGTAEGEAMSPAMDLDTPGGEAGGQGSESGNGTDGNDVATLRAELDELRKRVQHGSKTAQQLRAAEQKLKAHEDRLARWKASNLDPDEVDKALGYVPQGQAAPAAGRPAVTPEDQSAHIQNAVKFEMFKSQWESQKDRFFEANPEFDSAGTRRYFDSEAWDIAKQEIEEFGRVVSKPSDISKKVEKRFSALEAAITKRVEKKVTEKRTQVGKQGVVESGHSREPRKGDVEETVDMDSPEYLEQYAGGFRKHREGFRAKK